MMLGAQALALHYLVSTWNTVTLGTASVIKIHDCDYQHVSSF